jgi:hypothetical protein
MDFTAGLGLVTLLRAVLSMLHHSLEKRCAGLIAFSIAIKNGDVLPDHLLLGKAEHAPGRVVAAGDGPRRSVMTMESWS